MTRRLPVVRIGIVALLALVVATGSGWARNGRRPRPATKARPAPRTLSAPRTARFTLEFVGADISDVFQALATQSGVNIITSSSVSGKTTLRLHNVTLTQALNIVTKVNGLEYAWVDASYVVGTPEEIRSMKVADLRTSVAVLRYVPAEYAQEAVSKVVPDVTVSAQKGVRSVLLLGPDASLAKAEKVIAEIDVPTPPTTEVLPVRYVEAKKVSQMITQAVPDCTVQPGPQQNSLLITANGQQWQTIHSLASQVDAAPTPSQATSAVYYVKYTSPQELQTSLSKLLPDLQVVLAPRSYTPVVQKASGGTGSALDSLAALQLSSGTSSGGGASGTGTNSTGIQVEAAPVTALILSGSPVAVERGMQLLAELDKAPQQVHIAAMITEINRADIRQLGIDWSSLGTPGASFTIGEPGPSTSGGSGTSGLTEGNARGLQVGKIMRTPIQWMGVVRTLEQQNRARVLSNPSVTTLDGRQTSLHAGDTIYFPSATAINGQVALSQATSLQTGVTLTVNPRLNDKGEITMTLAPTISSLSNISFGGLPSVNERALVTTVRVKSGETTVLAGLISDEERVTVTKIPFLGNVPILGELFKYRDREPQHTEVMIFVTPTIVSG